MSSLDLGDISSWAAIDNNYYLSSCELSTNYHLVCYADASDSDKLKARICQIVNGEIVFHDAVEVDASASAHVSCCNKDTDEAFIFWGDEPDSDTLNGMWIERNGTSITTKTATAINDPAAELKGVTRCCKLDTDKALLIFYNVEDGTFHQEIWAIAVEPSADAISVGAALNIRDTAAMPGVDRLCVTQMDTDVAIIGYSRSTLTAFHCHHITAAALVLTDASTVEVDASNVDACAVAGISTTKAIALYSINSDGNARGSILDISGAISASAPVTFLANQTCDFINAVKLNSTKVMFTYLGASDYPYVCIATEDAGDVTFITPEVIESQDCYESEYVNMAMSLVSEASSIYLTLSVYGSDALNLCRALLIQWQNAPAATGYIGIGSITDHPRLVATGDADYSYFRIYEDGTVRAFDAIAKNDAFSPYPLRMYKAAVYPIRDESAE